MPEMKTFSAEEIKDKMSSIVWDQNNPYVVLFLGDPIAFIRSFEVLHQESNQIIKSTKQIVEKLEKLLPEKELVENVKNSLDDETENLTPEQIRFLQTPFLDLDISVRAFNKLTLIIEHIIGVSSKEFTVADIIREIPVSLMVKQRDFGKKSIFGLQNYFAEHDVYLREDVPGYETIRRTPPSHSTN